MITFTDTSYSPIIEDGIITVLSSGLTLEPNGYEVVNTNVSIDIPEGHIVQSVNDFSTFSRNIVVSVVGDSPIYVKIQNLGLMPLTIHPGDILVKLIIMSYIRVDTKQSKNIKFIEFQKFPEFEDWIMNYLKYQRTYLFFKIKTNLREEFASILLEANIIYGKINTNFVNYIINMSPNYIINQLEKIYEKERIIIDKPDNESHDNLVIKNSSDSLSYSYSSSSDI